MCVTRMVVAASGERQVASNADINTSDVDGLQSMK